MERKVIGLEKISYTSKKSGQSVEGIILHTIGKSGSVVGMAAEQFFISARAEGVYADATTLQPDMVVDIQFNRFGNIDAIYPVTEG